MNSLKKIACKVLTFIIYIINGNRRQISKEKTAELWVIMEGFYHVIFTYYTAAIWGGILSEKAEYS